MKENSPRNIIECLLANLNTEYTPEIFTDPFGGCMACASAEAGSYV